MSGLVGYGSSDEDDEVPETKLVADSKVAKKVPFVASSPAAQHQEFLATTRNVESANGGQDVQRVGLDSHKSESPNRAVSKNEDPVTSHAAKDSLFNATIGTTLRNLTLPSVPNLDIPPSPPGSPPQTMTAKVAKFLELKQQGVHFNEKLAASSSLKNPSLLGKLSTFAGLDHADQYATTLPLEIWNPSSFPGWAYKDQLAKAQEDANRSREEKIKKGLRPGVEFVQSKKT